MYLCGLSNVAVGISEVMKTIIANKKRFTVVCKYILYIELTFIHNRSIAVSHGMIPHGSVIYDIVPYDNLDITSYS